MSDEKRKQIEKRVMILSLGILIVLAGCMVAMGIFHVVNMTLYPIVVSVFLLAYWLVADVFSIKWLNDFADKTPEQKNAYYIYALVDLVGLGGLVYFLVDMKSTTGALIYVVCIFAKKKFHEDFTGKNNSLEDEDLLETSEPESDTKEE